MEEAREQPEPRGMVFYRRPDLVGPQLLFQRPRGAQVGDNARPQAPPAQLVALDGRSKLGLPLLAQPPGGRRAAEAAAETAVEGEGRRARPERPPRVRVRTQGDRSWNRNRS